MPKIGDIAMQNAADEMRLGHHPAPQWEVDKYYWVLRTIEQYMPTSQEKRDEAWAEHRAMKKDEPAKPYQRREEFAVPS